MSLADFIVANSGAFVALAGVVVGSVLTAVFAISLQVLQRRWALQDESRQWRRDRLLIRLSPIIDWMDITLRMMRAFISSMQEGYVKSDFWDGIEEDLRLHFREHEHHDAIVLSHAISIGDKELNKLVNAFSGIRNDFMSVITEEDSVRIEAHRMALDVVASKTTRRIEYLLEKAKPLPGPYLNDSWIHRFRQRIRESRKEQPSNSPESTEDSAPGASEG